MAVDSPLMQEVDRATAEQLRIVVRALERDKRNLAEQLKQINSIIEQGDNVRFCRACGVYYASGNKCDCTTGIDY